MTGIENKYHGIRLKQKNQTKVKRYKLSVLSSDSTDTIQAQEVPVFELYKKEV